MQRARWVQRIALTGAAGFAFVALVPVGAAPAATDDKPNFFSVDGKARGVEILVNTRPEPFPVSNAINEAFPYARSNVQAGGVSEAEAESLYTGGAETAPGLLCSFAPPDENGQTFCDKSPRGVFPPPYPFEAQASYPVTPESEAIVSGRFGGGDNPNDFTVGPVRAEAQRESARALAALTHGAFLGGTPLEVDTGSTRALTEQFFEGNVMITRARSDVEDVTIANLIKIKSVTAVAEIHNNGQDKPVNKSSVTVKGVSVGPLDARIDQDGISLVGSKLAKAQVNRRIEQLGIEVRAIGVDSTAKDEHSLDVTAAGLRVDFRRSFEEICAIGQLCQGLPPICEEDPLAGTPFSSLSILINICRPPTPNPRDTYIFTANIGYTNATSNASLFRFDPSDVPPPPPPPTDPNGDGTGEGTTTFVPGEPGTPGTPGTPGAPGAEVAPPPEVAGPGGGGGTLAGFSEDLSGVDTRLSYLFPCLLLAVIGALAGRVSRAPARLPDPST